MPEKIILDYQDGTQSNWAVGEAGLNSSQRARITAKVGAGNPLISVRDEATGEDLTEWIGAQGIQVTAPSVDVTPEAEAAAGETNADTDSNADAPAPKAASSSGGDVDTDSLVGKLALFKWPSGKMYVAEIVKGTKANWLGFSMVSGFVHPDERAEDAKPARYNKNYFVRVVDSLADPLQNEASLKINQKCLDVVLAFAGITRDQVAALQKEQEPAETEASAGETEGQEASEAQGSSTPLEQAAG